MQHLFQSSFLQALGYAIANSLWQTALVWLIYMSVTGLLSIGASAKYRLAVAAQVTGFIWFLITFQFYYNQYSNAWQHSGGVPVSQNIQAIVSANTDLSSRLINWMVKGEQVLPYISMAYLLLMVFLCIRWFLGYQQTQLIRKNGLHKMPADWRLFVKKIAAQLGIKKEIRIFLSDTITTPLTIGFLKPVILIPVASINHLTTDQLEAVLLHELAHIKRYDYLVNIILSVVEISLFFNPFTQLLSKNIHKERENSCDDWVLQFKYNATEYAEALLRIAYMQNSPAFAMAASGKKNDLLVRVQRMIHQKENRFSYRRQLLSFVIVTGILCSIAWLNPIKPHTGQSNAIAAVKKLPNKKIQAYAVEPMAVSVDNPLFNPVFFLSKPLKAEMKKNIESAQKEIEAATVSYQKQPYQFVESFTPMVAGALEQAAAAMTNTQLPDWEKEIARMETAKEGFSKTWRTDSALLPSKIKRRFKEDFNRSMQDMEGEIKKAKTEIERSAKLSTDVYFDKEKVQLDLQKAIESVEQLKKMGLDKVVIDVMRIPFTWLDEKSGLRMRIKQPTLAPPAPEEGTRMKKRMPMPAIADKELPSTPTSAPPAMEEDRNENDPFIDKEKEEPKSIQPAGFVLAPRLLAFIPELEKMGYDMATIQKIKAIIIQQALAKKVKLVPLIVKEKGSEDKKFIIQLQ